MANQEEILQELRTIGGEAGTGSSSTQFQGAAAAGATATGNPVQVGVVYNPSGVSLSNGGIWPLQGDVNANAKMTLATALAGEDLTNDVIKTERRYSNVYLTLASLTLVKSGAGHLHRVTFGHGSNPTLTIYDNTSGSGAIMQVFGAGYPAGSYVLDETHATGIAAVFAAPGNAIAVSIGYR